MHHEKFENMKRDCKTLLLVCSRSYDTHCPCLEDCVCVCILLSLVGMVTKPSSEQSQDFSIHNEDFPALPGTNYQTKDPTSSTEDAKTVSPSSHSPTHSCF